MKVRFHQRGADSLRPLRRETAVEPEDRDVAALLGQVEPLPPASEIAEVRIRRRLEQERSDERRSHSVPIWFKAMVGVAASLFLLETAAAAAISAWPALHDRFWATVAAHLPSPGKQHLRAGLGVPAQTPARAHAEEPQTEAPAADGPGIEAPAPTVPRAVVDPFGLSLSKPEPARPLASRHALAASSPRPEAAPRPPSAEAELALYSRALAQLNLEHDPAAALGTLSVYAFKYPNGILRGESLIAQLKAELTLGRDAEVLGLLDAMDAESFAGVPQAQEVRFLRAELLVKAARCNDALQSLTPYLDPSTPPGLRERALSLRATCRAREDRSP
jgi:hypothetical protein